MYIAKICVRQLTCSLAKATENGEVCIDLLGYILLNDEEALFLGRIPRIEGDLKECFDVIMSHESTRFFQILEKTKTSLDFLAVVRDTTGIKAFEESYCFVKPPIFVRNGCKTYTVYAPDIDLLKEAYKRLKKVGNWKVLEVKNIDSNDKKLANRQLSILKTAYEMGYFDKKRRAKLKDIASAMNLSKSAVHKHIHESLSKIIEMYLRKEKIDIE